MPPQALLAAICSAFTCTPEEALRQDWGLVQAVMETQALETARQIHNEDVTKMTPGLAKLWHEAMKAREALDG